MDRSAGRGWILPAFNSSRSVYLLISSGLERRIATPCQMFFSSSRVFLLGGRGVFQQLWRRIINGLLLGEGCVRSNRSGWIWGGETVVLGDVSHGVIWKREIWNWISEKLFVFLGEKIIVSQDYC